MVGADDERPDSGQTEAPAMPRGDGKSVALGTEPTQLTGNPSYHDGLGYLEYDNQEITPEDIVERGLQFLPVDEFEYDRSRNEILAWIRIPVAATLDREKTYFLHISKGHFWKAGFYVTEPDGTIVRESDYSAVRPSSNINDLSRVVAFPFVVGPGRQRDLYLRLKVYDIEAVELSIYPADHHVAFVAAERIVVGILLGVLLGLFVYNAVVLPSLRDRAYGFYLGFLVAAGGYIITVNRIGASVTNAIFAWYPETPSTLFVAAGLVLAVLFSREFLRTRETMPLLHRVMLALIVAVPVVVVVDLLGVLPRPAADGGLVLLIVAALLAAGIVGIRQRRAEAVDYLVSIVFFCAGTIMSILVDLGIRPNGAAYFFDVAAQPGIVLSLLFLSLSIARKVRRMRKREAELMEINAAKSEFLANASHELRAPLSCIRLAIESLVEKDSPESKRAPGHAGGNGTLESVLTQIDRLAHHIDNLLLRSRVDFPARHVLRERVDLADLVDTLAAELRPLAEDRGLTLLSVYDSAHATQVVVDRSLLSSVVINLLDNAIKFTGTGGRITTRVTGQGDNVVLTVADTGRGIPEDRLEAVFDRHVKNVGDEASDAAKREPGEGIGLSIVRDIVTLHGGTVSVESSVGDGSTFFVSLPAAAATGGRSLAGCEDLDLDATTGDRAALSQAPRVLLVEDDNALRDHIGRLLGRRFRVQAAENLADAKRLLAENEFDVVLSDVRLPDGEGLALSAVLSGRSDGRDTPIVFLSGVADQQAVIRGLRSGAVDYIRKPFVGEELEARLLSVVAAHQRTAEAQRKSLIRHIESWQTGAIPSAPGRGTDLPQIQERYGLSERQTNVLDLVMKGYTDSEIGSMLGISHRTVGHHVSIILGRVGVDRRTQLTFELLGDGETGGDNERGGDESLPPPVAENEPSPPET